MIKWRNFFVADVIFMWLNGLAAALAYRADETALQVFFISTAAVCFFAMLPLGVLSSDQEEALRREKNSNEREGMRTRIKDLEKERDEMIDRYLDIESRWTSGNLSVPPRPETEAFAERAKKRGTSKIGRA